MTINLSSDPKQFERVILDLGKKYELTDPEKVKSILSKYEKIPVEFRSLRKLTGKLKYIYPNLFSHNIVLRSNKVIDQKTQEIHKQKIFRDQAEHLSTLDTIEKINKYLKGVQQISEKIEKRVLSMFPKSSFDYSSRVKESESLLRAIKLKKVFPLGDVIGLRMIPKQSALLPEAIKKFEETFGDELIYKTNNLALSQKQLIKLKGYGSTYYNAIHYHLPVDRFFTEIQIRTPGVNQWSKLAHYTVYKKKIKTDSITRQCIMEFGKRASIVDYFEILTG